MNTEEYLDAVKERHEIESDYKLAQQLNITRAAVSKYRKYGKYLDNFTCYQVAESLNIDPRKVLIDIALEKERNEDKREFWQEKLNQLKVIPAVFFISIISFSAIYTPPVDASNSTVLSDEKGFYLM